MSEGYPEKPPAYQEPPAGQYPPQQQPYPPQQGGYPAPPPQAGGYPQQQQPQNYQTVIVAQAPVRLGEFPAVTQCPHCHASVTTTIQWDAGMLTWVLAGVCLFFGMWLGCCLIPFCVNGCKDVSHSCPNCGKNIGTYRRLS